MFIRLRRRYTAPGLLIVHIINEVAISFLHLDRKLGDVHIGVCVHFYLWEYGGDNMRSREGRGRYPAQPHLEI
jgi:hypothetical protein